ncbi:hypothetical protein HHI36_005839 [Cryptolaemus montrouzieri]|uniref:Dehydrogenase/reductase SDR family member 11 n=1 Tax=Cryptolaemus montrouzieri TaxID=559131 RepID=A0ABD2NVH4_9CUCU
MVLSMDRWIGKVAVVTGASSGIGAAIAEHLVECGMKVVGLARRSERVEEMSKKLTGKKGVLHGLKVDVSIPEEIIEAFEVIEKRFGPVHILVNNAGLLKYTSLMDGDYKQWKETFDVNVMGLCVATKEAIQSMKRNNVDGHIIHINSVAGHVIPFHLLNVYPASKFAVTALTETLRVELVQSESKIKVTSISPGFVLTEMAKMDGASADILEKFPHIFPEDVADSVVYALSTPPHVQVHELIVRAVNAKD